MKLQKCKKLQDIKCPETIYYLARKDNFYCIKNMFAAWFSTQLRIGVVFFYSEVQKRFKIASLPNQRHSSADWPVKPISNMASAVLPPLQKQMGDITEAMSIIAFMLLWGLLLFDHQK